MKTDCSNAPAKSWWVLVLDDKSGSVTILAVVFFVVLMAVGGLAIDLQRLYGVHGQMQAYVDDVALAAATELDAQSGALTRAVDAASGGTNGPLLDGAGWQRFGTKDSGGATNDSLAVRKLIFLSQLGSPDPSPTDSNEPHAVDTSYVLCTVNVGGAAPACLTNSNAVKNSKFVEVFAVPRTVGYIVLPVANVIMGLFGQSITNQATIGLHATAGFRAAVCDITPMMICNPNEPAGNIDPNAPFDATALIGKQILVRSGGGGGGGSAAWVPGDFGWIDIPDDAGITDCQTGGHEDTGCVLGLVNPLTQCFTNNTLNVSAGQDNPTADGLNVRFDIYPNNTNIGPLHNANTDARLAPSVNVTKGICNTKTQGARTICDYSGNVTCPNPQGNGASAFSLASSLSSAAVQTVAIPRDSQWCDTSNNCVATPDQTHRFGNGTWNRATYWATNHGGDALPNSLTSATRYQMYRHEIDCANGTGCVGSHDGIPNYSSASGADKGENGDHRNSGNGAYCSNKAGVNNAARDRRVLYVAVVNCQASNLHGNSVSGSSVHVVAYLKVFLTEPVGFGTTGAWVGSNNAKDVYAEVVDVVKPNDTASIVHVFPVLYR